MRKLHSIYPSNSSFKRMIAFVSSECISQYCVHTSANIACIPALILRTLSTGQLHLFASINWCPKYSLGGKKQKYTGAHIKHPTHADFNGNRHNLRISRNCHIAHNIYECVRIHVLGNIKCNYVSILMHM